MTFGVLPASADDDATGERYVLFRAGSAWFAVHVGEVREIVALPRITEVPSAARAVRGVALVRGAVVTVLDAALGLGESPLPDAPTTRVLLVEIEDERLGLRVDEVARVARIDTSLALQRHELPGALCAPIMAVAHGAAPGGLPAGLVDSSALVHALLSEAPTTSTA